jgi:hypothetical protein
MPFFWLSQSISMYSFDHQISNRSEPGKERLILLFFAFIENFHSCDSPDDVPDSRAPCG